MSRSETDSHSRARLEGSQRSKLLVVLLFTVACNRKTASIADASPPAVVAPMAAPLPVVVVDAAPPAKVSRTSLAKLTAGILDECVDVSFQGEPADAGPNWDPTADFVKGAKRKDKDVMVVPKGCAVQFADRTPLAVCSFEKEQKGVRVAYTSNRYLFEDVGLSDTAMKECIEMGADWKSVPRDSKEWRAAKLDHSRRKLQRLGDRLATPDPTDD